MKQPLKKLTNIRDRLSKLHDHMEKQILPYISNALDEAESLLEALPTLLKETEEEHPETPPQKILHATKDILQETGRPMKVREILEALSERGVRTRAKNPYVSLYNSIRARKDLFQRTGEGQFTLVEGAKKTKGRPKKKG